MHGETVKTVPNLYLTRLVFKF